VRINQKEVVAATEYCQEQIKKTGRYPGRTALSRALSINEARARALLDRVGKDLKADTSHVDTFKLKKRLAEAEKQLREALERDVLSQSVDRFINGLTQAKPEPPQWVVAPAPKKTRIARPTALLSDGHWDEVVNPSEIEWLNGYDREIAMGRLQRFFENTVKIGRDFLKGIDFDGMVMPIGGDLFSGNIHEELSETNADTMCGSLLAYLDPMIAGIRVLADYYGRVFIPCVTGNHPRRRRKPSFKLRVRDNYEWLFYKILEREFAGDKRISFLIPESADVDWPIWGVKYRMTHGDQFRGGSGIAGALSPLMIGDARKRKRSQAAGRPFDMLIVGHWHQYFPRVKGLIVSGSLKGYDEYCYGNNFDYEKPTQSFWLTDPEHGMTIMAPIHVEGDDESWKQDRQVQIPEWMS
jgi:hypothetical protein